ncbi:MAG: dTDP-4-dehydrorhamnose reductase [Caldisericia bacterium]|jgi:dTDP-4-dehydrorhamnose reductase
MTVLVMGAGGRLGREFMDRLSSLGDLTGLTHVQCDVADSLAVERAVLELQPTVVINCAAQPSVDACEKDRDQAYRINVLGARNVAHAAYRVAAKVVHFGTDYVFDGTADHAYNEWDAPNPINWYGRTKLMSEEAVQRANPDNLILRIANVYGAHGDNTVTAVVRSAQSGTPLTLPDDQIMSPTSAAEIVQQTMLLIQRGATGLYHVTGRGQTSRYDFAGAVATILGLDVQLVPVHAADIPGRVPRPLRTPLAHEHLRLEGQDMMSEWDQALYEFLVDNRRALLPLGSAGK